MMFLRRATMLTLPAVVAAACTRAPPERAAPPPPLVTVATPVRMDAPIWLEYTGETAAIESAEIRARVEGYLLEKRFTDSADVREGQVLFVIDPAPYQAVVAQAEAEVERCRADLQQAIWDLERTESLAGRGASTEKEVQDRRTGKALAQAALDAAGAVLAKAELDLGYTEVRSPIDGRIGRNLVDAGNLVGAGEKTLLANVVMMDPMYVYFNVAERVLMQRLAELPPERRRPADRGPDPGIPFWVRVAREQGFPHEGHLDFIDNTVDPSTGTILVRGVVPNDEALLFPGAFVRVRISAGIRENAVLVEERALGTDVGGKYLLVVGAGDVVEQRPVEIGPLVDGMRVIERGLDGGERYIVNGLQRARPGLPVRPETEPGQG